MLRDDHLLQAMHAAGVHRRNVVYVSVPITSGEREIALLDETGLRSSLELRTTKPDTWRERVLEPNSQDADRRATAVRSAAWVPHDFVVVDPSRITVQGWEQDDYNRFWVRLMEEHVRYLVSTPGWQFSRGARTEVGYALTFSDATLEIVDVTGTPLSPTGIRASAEEARRGLMQRGWLQEEIDAYLPPLREERPDLSPSAQSQAFGWLIAERRFQVRHYGPEQDDRHLVDGGLRPEGWWSKQFTHYLDRARAADLRDEDARLELAKFVATAVAMLESAIRVHGPVPRPGDERDRR
jgi:hypothetical protein